LTAAADLADVPVFDVAIDFSLPTAFDPILALCRERGAAFVSGTTGLDSRQLIAIDTAAAKIPLLWTANFSLGVAVLADLVRRAAVALPAWDCDIVETHHTQKRDAPSGTALHFGAQIEAGRGTAPHYASLRAGDVIGEHLIQFTTAGERIELVHRATDREIFARNALHAACALASRPAGRYDLFDLLGGAG